jgi:hypothetical protein
MTGNTYDQSPHLHPLIEPTRDALFGYSWYMFPGEFRNYYHQCPVRLAGGKNVHVSVLKYQAGWSAGPDGQKYNLKVAIRKFQGSKISPILDSWLNSSRPTAVFAGHGLPEEISVVCRLAVECGFVSEADLASWVTKWIGIDCNGFVSAYYMSIGTFSRTLHNHPSYLDYSKPAKSTADITYDSCMLWAKDTTHKGKPSTYKVVQNPSISAHIAVIDDWHEYGSSLVVTERGGANRFDGPSGVHQSIYDIVDKPPGGCTDEQAGWTVRSRDRKKSDHVIITRRMGTR